MQTSLTSKYRGTNNRFVICVTVQSNNKSFHLSACADWVKRWEGARAVKCHNLCLNACMGDEEKEELEEVKGRTYDISCCCCSLGGRLGNDCGWLRLMTWYDFAWPGAACMQRLWHKEIGDVIFFFGISGRHILSQSLATNICQRWKLRYWSKDAWYMSLKVRFHHHIFATNLMTNLLAKLSEWVCSKPIWFATIFWLTNKTKMCDIDLSAF
jgi:hypothetical protein